MTSANRQAKCIWHYSAKSQLYSCLHRPVFHHRNNFKRLLRALIGLLTSVTSGNASEIQ